MIAEWTVVGDATASSASTAGNTSVSRGRGVLDVEFDSTLLTAGFLAVRQRHLCRPLAGVSVVGAERQALPVPHVVTEGQRYPRTIAVED
jgi:hypothetical protein